MARKEPGTAGAGVMSSCLGGLEGCDYCKAQQAKQHMNGGNEWRWEMENDKLIRWSRLSTSTTSQLSKALLLARRLLNTVAGK